MGHAGRPVALALALFASACGKVNTFTDAGDDDSTIDANGATLTVTTYSRTGRQTIVSGVDVVATHADGSVAAMAQSDADGHATLEVRAGDSVTAVYPRVDGSDLVTYIGVKPGDQLVFGLQAAPSMQTAAGTMTVTWLDVGDSSYRVYHPCGNAYGGAQTSSSTMTLYQHCRADVLDLFFVGFDASGNVARWAKIDDVTFVNGGTVGITEWQQVTAFTFTVTGLPLDVVSTNVSASPLVDGQSSYSGSTSGTPADGMYSYTMPWAATGEPIAVVGSFRRTGNFGAQGQFEQLPANATQWTLDTPISMPWVGETLASAAAREITWVQTDEGAYDAAVVISRWEHTNADAGIERGSWNFVAPPGVDRISIPELPGPLAAYTPLDTDSLDANAVLIDVLADDGYDAYRQRPESEVLGLFYSGQPPATALKLSISSN